MSHDDVDVLPRGPRGTGVNRQLDKTLLSAFVIFHKNESQVLMSDEAMSSHVIAFAQMG
jgi:hypothetical protein